nr:acetyltransferase [uncultured Sellimonas sp.]
MNKRVVIIGASGHGKVVADIVKKSGDQVVGFLDDNTNLGDTFIGLPVLGRIEKFYEYQSCQFVIGIGNSEVREKIAEKLKGVKWYTAIHPSAVLSDIDIVIKEGTVIMANAVINSGTTIGKHCIINSGAIVEHDNQIEDFVHISVGAKTAGMVYVGKRTWIGIGTSICNNLSICSNCMIGAGTVVIHDIERAGTYIGVPARRIK